MNPKFLRPVLIAGSGGGGKASTPTQTADNIRTEMYAQVLDLISEGEIEGFIDGLGNSLTNAVLSPTPTIVKGVVQNNGVLVSGGSGYTVIDPITGTVLNTGTFTMPIVDPLRILDGSTYGINAGYNALATITVVNGVVTEFNVTNGGLNYSSGTTVQAPYSIGKSIYLDSTLLQGYDHKYNFIGTVIDYRLGTQSQSHIPNFPSVEQSTSVGIPFAQSTTGPVQATVESDTVDTALVGVQLSALYFQSYSTGDILPTSVSYTVHLSATATSPTGDGLSIANNLLVATEVVTGKTSAPYMQESSIDLRGLRSLAPTGSYAYKWTFIVTRVTPDRDFQYNDKLTFSYITMVTNKALTYPNSAIVALKMDAQNFSRIPVRGYRVRLLKIQVPTNYFPLTRLYNRTSTGLTRTGQFSPVFTVNLIDDSHSTVTFQSLIGKVYEVYSAPAEEFPRSWTLRLTTSGTGSPITSPSYNTNNGDMVFEVYGYDSDFPAGSAVVDDNGNPVEQPWDGTFYTVWSNNPAWVFYDLATNTRYGAGKYLTGIFGQVDKWSLYQIARYCDELVPDGFGGTEPRFVANIYLQTREDAFKVLTNFASVFRGMLYWASGTIVAVQDSKTTSQTYSTFNESNVKGGTFTYSGTSRKARHTVAAVTFNDPANFYKQAVEYVDSPEGILLYGIRQLDINGFGCASRGQAHRLGLWLLYTDIYETGTVTFRTGFEAAHLRPFCIVKIFDVHRAGVPFAGRILVISADRLTVTTDQTNTIPLSAYGNGFTFIAVNPSPTVAPGAAQSVSDAQAVMASQLVSIPVASVSGGSGTNIVIQLISPLPPSVPLGSVWGMESSSIQGNLFRVLNVTEIEHNEFEVTAVTYNPEKYAYVEQNVSLTKTTNSLLNLAPGPVTNLTLTSVYTLNSGGTPIYKVDISWSPPSTSIAQAYDIYFGLVGGNMSLLTTTSSYQVEATVQGGFTYQVQVIAKGIGGLVSAAVSGSVSVGEEAVAAADDQNTIYVERITGLELMNQGNDQEFTGPDIHVVWRRNSPFNCPEIGSEPNGASSGRLSDNFLAYRIRIYDPAALTDPTQVQLPQVIYETTTTSTSFTLTHTQNVQLAANRSGTLAGIAYRSLVFEVSWQSNQNNFSRADLLPVSNPPPAAISVGSVTVAQPSAGSPVFLTMPLSTESDFNGYRVWASTVSGYVPAESTLIYDGQANPIIVTLAPGTWYLHFMEKDLFSTQVMDGNLSATKTITVS